MTRVYCPECYVTRLVEGACPACSPKPEHVHDFSIVRPEKPANGFHDARPAYNVCACGVSEVYFFSILPPINSETL